MEEEIDRITNTDLNQSQQQMTPYPPSQLKDITNPDTIDANTE